MQKLLHDRYRLIKTLGCGGFGETILACDTQNPSGRYCVIKRLMPIYNNPRIYKLVQERFQREAAILEHLGSSSNAIPSLYDFFESGGQFYLVQEYIEGETLLDKVERDGTLSENGVRQILVSLLSVIKYIHSQGIIHRDIKPENIILRDRDNLPVLIDFGAVREIMGTVTASSGRVTSEIVVGTPGYMSNEQAAGRPVYSSDLYSLGITAIYLLTGKQPQKIHDPQTGDILWDSYAFNISPTMKAIIKGAIAPAISDRFRSAQEMLDALENSTPIVPTQASPTAGSVKCLNTAIAAIAGAVFGASVIALIFLAQKPKVEANTNNFPTVFSTSADDKLNQVIPNHITGALSAEDAFTQCPNDTSLQLVGSTADSQFIVCGFGNAPRYYIGEQKATGEKINVVWKYPQGFFNGNYLYLPPGFSHNTSFANPRLQVYENGRLIRDDRVTKLYQRS